MYVITITKWKRKLVALLVIALLVIGLGMGVDWFLSPEDSEVTAPADQDLQEDILDQPVKVQGEPAGEVENVPQANDK